MATTPAEKQQQDFAAEFDAAFEVADLGVGKFYFNGFSMVVGVADGTILFKQNDKAAAIASGSLPVLKELALKILSNLHHLEQAMGTTIQSTEELTKIVVAHQQKAAK